MKKTTNPKKIASVKGFRFPNSEEIDSAMKRLDKTQGTSLLSEDASDLERVKFKVCEQYIKYLQEQEITQVVLAKRLGLDQAVVSRILKYNIKAYTLDFLLKNLEKISALSPEISFRKNRKTG